VSEDINKKIYLWYNGDITNLSVDAVVNSTNETLNEVMAIIPVPFFFFFFETCAAAQWRERKDHDLGRQGHPVRGAVSRGLPHRRGQDHWRSQASRKVRQDVFLFGPC